MEETILLLYQSEYYDMMALHACFYFINFIAPSPSKWDEVKRPRTIRMFQQLAKVFKP
jgi:hypothetical protein